MSQNHDNHFTLASEIIANCSYCIIHTVTFGDCTEFMSERDKYKDKGSIRTSIYRVKSNTA